MITITKGIFKNRPCFQLENEDLRVAILPEFGGKIVSLYHKKKDFELLFQNRGDSYQKAEPYDDFGAYDASGFDDCFPTINECLAPYDGREIRYPNHGEIWSATMAGRIEKDGVKLSCHSSILPYVYQKRISLRERTLTLAYRIKNTGRAGIPCLWAMHCLVNCEEDMQLIFPEGTGAIVNVHPSRFLGRVGREHPFPVTCTPGGKAYFLDRVLPGTAGNVEKYYVQGKVSRGVCGIFYPRPSLTFQIRYDEAILPYLGFWVTEGGFRGDYNCALEPTNGFYDDIPTAAGAGCLYVLKAGAVLDFRIQIELDEEVQERFTPSPSNLHNTGLE